ncbi:hypothetical protein [Halorientalis halophila]|uniref:hypothetical protein n=1 Tax=Halorientalis halophila TaxID=3108499 RepID=UPI003007F579
MTADIGELIVAGVMLIVGVGVIAILNGANASTVTGLMESGITLVVYVGVLAIIAITLLSIVGGGR